MDKGKREKRRRKKRRRRAPLSTDSFTQQKKYHLSTGFVNEDQASPDL